MHTCNGAGCPERPRSRFAASTVRQLPGAAAGVALSGGALALLQLRPFSTPSRADSVHCVYWCSCTGHFSSFGGELGVAVSCFQRTILFIIPSASGQQLAGCPSTPPRSSTRCGFGVAAPCSLQNKHGLGGCCKCSGAKAEETPHVLCCVLGVAVPACSRQQNMAQSLPVAKRQFCRSCRRAALRAGDDRFCLQHKKLQVAFCFQGSVVKEVQAQPPSTDLNAKRAQHAVHGL